MKKFEEYRYTSSSNQPVNKSTSFSTSGPNQQLTLSQSYSTKPADERFEFSKKASQQQAEGFNPLVVATSYSYTQKGANEGEFKKEMGASGQLGYGGAGMTTITSSYVTKPELLQSSEVEYRKSVAEGFRSEKFIFFL